MLRKMVSAIGALLLTAACASTDPIDSFSTKTNLTTEQKTSLDEARYDRLVAFLPVEYGTDRTGHTVQCMFIPGAYNQVAVYPSHNPPGMSGAVTEGAYWYMADKECNVIYRQSADGLIAPIKIDGTRDQRDGVGVRAIQAVSTVAGATMNGAVASVLAPGCNGAACGIVNLVNGGNAIAGANSSSGSASEVNVTETTTKQPAYKDMPY